MGQQPGRSAAGRMHARRGLREGDSVEAEVTPAGEITLTPAKPFDKAAAFLGRTRKRRAAMPLTEPVVERMRKEARY